MAKKAARKSTTQNPQLTYLERLVRKGFQRIDGRLRVSDARMRGITSEIRSFRKQTDSRFRLVHLRFDHLQKQIDARFATVDERIGRLADHVDGFMKLHETLFIEFKVIKEQMNRL